MVYKSCTQHTCVHIGAIVLNTVVFVCSCTGAPLMLVMLNAVLLCDCRFPAAKFPVIALSSPPANFPVSKEDAYVQRYFKWSPAIRRRVLDFKRDRLDNQPYLAAHVRLGDDWVSA